MAMNSASMVAAEGEGIRSSSSPFTGSQWQELEHQALIFKYLMAGIPVPPHLLLPIQKSFHAVSTAFFNDPSSNTTNSLLISFLDCVCVFYFLLVSINLGYCSLYGKKVDPEPDRCRRTDGKKWRCSKDAYPDSKYCERHMHRGRNRSRKPVESQVVSQSSSSTVTSLAVTEINSSSSGAGSFQNLPLHTFGNSQGPSAGSNQFQLHLESIPYGVPHKDYRAKISAELSLQSKLGEPPRRSLEQSLPKTTTVRAKALVTSGLSLFSKLGIITAMELGRGAMADGNPERCQETEGDLYVRVLLTAGWRRRQLMMSY
ncbi:growth-regulating factor 3 [Actinidia rufa]|uniref:Growth-regulating factor n=1 Tax=Actinidia rufa TaxID=165716 RepID=A0A7J0E5Q0_9ERIC|nr:growth-regulating factor 3 [Actinidia rufa]